MRLTQGLEFGLFKAAADYSAVTNYGLLAAKNGTASQVAKASVAGQPTIGYFQSVAASGHAITVQYGGVAEALLGGTVTMGDRVTGDANAKTVKLSAIGQYVIGIALASGVDGDIIPVLVTHQGKAPGWKHVGSFLAATFANGDMLTSVPLPAAGTITNFYAQCTKAVTTSAKAATLNLEIGTTDLTGGTIALSGTYTLGAVVACASITGGNTFAAGDVLSLEASSVTTFSEGSFDVVIEALLN